MNVRPWLNSDTWIGYDDYKVEQKGERVTSSTDQGVTDGGGSYAFFVSFVAAFGGFLFGYDLIIISGVQLFIRTQFALSPAQFGFATSSALLGCIAGPSLGAWMCDRL